MLAMSKKKYTAYKYKIHTYLLKCTVSDYQIAMKFFPERLGISERTFRDWIYITADSHRQIPASALLVFAQFFNVEPNMMLEEPIEAKKDFENFKRKIA